jgi:hypothetical protein
MALHETIQADRERRIRKSKGGIFYGHPKEALSILQLRTSTEQLRRLPEVLLAGYFSRAKEFFGHREGTVVYRNRGLSFNEESTPKNKVISVS